jgi:hypothetical protein
MTWVLDHTDDTNVYWRREEDGHVIGFNRKGIGSPWSDENSPPADIDKYAEPISERAAVTVMDAIAEKLATIERDITDLKKGKG